MESHCDWFAIHVRARHERAVGELLRQKGYEQFVPTCRSHVLGGKVDISVPLFPGYLFCHFDPYDRRVPIVSTSGVIRIIGAGKVPMPVSREELDAVRTIVDSGILALPHYQSAPGEAVIIVDGPLRGARGTLESVKDKWRLVVAITLLQRSISVAVDRNWVRPAGPGFMC
jgi:transcriptional antiterminator RfaH